MSKAPAHETTTFAQVTTTTPASVPPASIFSISRTQQIVQLVLTVASVVIVLAGLWIATKLAPLVQDIALVKQAAAEQDRRIDDMKTDITQIRSNTDQTRTDVAEIKGLLQGSKQSSVVPRSTSVATAAPQPTPVPQSTPQPVQINQTFVSPTAEPSASKAPEPTTKPNEPNGPPSTPPGLLKPILELL